MSSKLQISTRVRRLFHYLEDFERGIIRVPAFQRDFEWTHKKKIKLFDSIKNGYPIGSILFWRPDFTTLEDFKNFESNKIGSYFLKERSADYFYILDGYQRLSTLFGCLVNPEKTLLKRDFKEWKEEFNLIYNLETDEIEFFKKSKYEIYEVPLFKFIDGMEFYNFQKDLLETDLEDVKKMSYLERYRNFGIKLSSYDIPSIDMIGGTTVEAIDIFTRLNSEGAKITNDWILSALSFSRNENFRLGSEIDNLLKNLTKYNFQDLKRKVIFQSITNSFGSEFFDKIYKNDTKVLEELAKDKNFVTITRKTFSSTIKAVNFLFEDLQLIDYKLLPYPAQLIFITVFFNKVDAPSKNQLEILKNWFWVTTYSNYFTRYNLSKQRIAYEQFQSFIENEKTSPIYYEKGSFETAEFPVKISMGSVRAKALALFMLNFKSNNHISNSELISRYHSYKLFEDKGNITENTILIREYERKLKNKDFSDWLNLEECHEGFFITGEMKKAYRSGISKDVILDMRKKHIIQNEKEFVENLLIKYVVS